MKYQKIIILEGVDKTGKTTYAERLSKPTGHPIVHLGVPEAGHYKKLCALIKHYSDGVIFDRFHWGDVAYAGIIRPEAALSDSEFNDIEELLKEAEARIVYCWDWAEKLRDRFNSDAETLIPESKIPLLLSRYEELIANTKLEVVRHNKSVSPLPLGNALITGVMVENKIKHYRRKIGLTQSELADKMGIKLTTIQQHELNQRVVGQRHWRNYSKGLGVSVSRLFHIK